MRRVIDLMLKDLRQVTKDPMSALFLLIMPLMFTAFMGIVFRFEAEEDPRVPVAVWNQDEGSVLGAYLIELLDLSSIVQPVIVSEIAEAEIIQAVREDDYAAAIRIPTGYTESIMIEQEAEPVVIMDENATEGRTAKQAIEAALQRVLGAVETARSATAVYVEKGGSPDEAAAEAFFRETLAEAVAAWRDPPYTLEVEQNEALQTEEAHIPSGFLQASPGMMVQFSLFGLIASASILVLERKSHTLQRLLTTPITAAQTIAGHVLGMFVIILAEELVLVLAGQLLFGVNYAQSPFAVLLILVALALFAASLGLLISALAKTEDQVIIYALVAMMLLSTLGGAQFPLEIAGEAFATVGSILPSYWAMQGLQNVIVRGQGVASVLKPVAILIAYALGTFVLAVWRFSFEGD